MKKCQICGKRASMFLTQIINGKASELALCEECAKAKGLFDPQTLTFAEKFFPEDFRKRVDKLVEELGMVAADLAQHADKQESKTPLPDAEDLLTQCPVCNFTLEDYRRTGRLGCPDCYRVFAGEIHGGEAGQATETEAAGEIPKPAESLQERLEQAIASENYEEAARLRDQLRELNGGSPR